MISAISECEYEPFDISQKVCELDGRKVEILPLDAVTVSVTWKFKLPESSLNLHARVIKNLGLPDQSESSWPLGKIRFIASPWPEPISK